MLISNIRDDVAGRFRQGDELVRVGSHIAPHSSKINDEEYGLEGEDKKLNKEFYENHKNIF